MVDHLNPHPDRLIVYGSPTCPSVPTVLGLLKQTGIAYDYVDIHRDRAARDRVRTINHGYDSVPTLVFPDGEALTEPTTGDLKRKLEALGYRVPLLAQLTGNLWLIIIAIGVILALLRSLGVF